MGERMKHLLKELAFALLLMIGMGTVIARADDGTPLEQEKKLAQAYLEKMKAEPGAEVIDGGVILKSVFRAESGRFATLQDDVVVLYQGFDREGVDFDNAFTRDQTETFPLAKLIRCWQIAIPRMPLGSHYKVTCPSDTAYGDKGTSDGAIKPGAAISFRISLLNAQAPAPAH